MRTVAGPRRLARPSTFARFALLRFAALLPLVIGACDEPPRHGESARVARPLCEAACERRARCEDDGPCECARARDTGTIRGDWATAAIACAKGAPCDDDVDCDAIAAERIGVRPLDQPGVVLRCLSKGDACGGSFAQCRRLAALTDDARAEVDRCAALDCDAWRACFAAFWRSEVAPAAPSWR
jgi:hypothetical protein